MCRWGKLDYQDLQKQSSLIKDGKKVKIDIKTNLRRQINILKRSKLKTQHIKKA